MSLVVEDGTGKPDAESYISVAEADAYHEAQGNTAWDDIASDVLKEQALRRAMRYLEGQYGLAWKGTRLYQLQALSWPRYDVFVDGYTLYTDVIPQDIKNAQAELALRTPTSDEQLAADLDQTVMSEKVGPIAVTYAEGSSGVVRYRLVDLMLNKYTTGGAGNQFKIVRG